MLATLLFVSNVLTVLPPMPVFIWDGTEGLLRSTSEVTDFFSTSSVVNFIKYAAGDSNEPPSSLSQYVLRTQLPEVVFVFVQPELHTSQVSTFGAAFQPNSDGGSFSNLKTFIENSPSLTLPYVYQVSDQSILEALNSVDNVHIVDAEDAPAFVYGRQSIFRDKKADVVVVKFSGLESNQNLKQKLRRDDSIMEQVIRRAQSQAPGKYIAVYTANSPTLTSHQATTFAKSQMLLSTELYNKQTYGASNTTTNILYMTPGVLSGLLVSLLLLLITSCGMCGLMALGTPDQFEREGGYLAGQ